MPSIAWIRRVLCMLILACVMLPLSSCTRHVYEEVPRKPGESQADHVARSIKTQVDMIYPSEMLQRGLENFAKEDLGAQATILWLLIAYAAPTASLFLSQRAQSAVHVVVGVPSVALLAFMVALYGNARIGGVLSIGAWTILIGLGVHALLAGWRRRRAARL